MSTNSKRVDLLTPGDTLSAWGPDLEVVSVKPAGKNTPHVLVKVRDVEDDTTTVIEYPPGVVVEYAEADEPEEVIEPDDEVDPATVPGGTELAEAAEAERAEREAQADAQAAEEASDRDAASGD